MSALNRIIVRASPRRIASQSEAAGASREQTSRKVKTLFILTVLSIAFFLRVLGIGYGLPDLSHPDEARVILDTLSMGQRMSLMPQRPDYALLYRYFLLFLFAVYYILGYLAGVFKDAADFAFKFIIDPSWVYLLARFVNVAFGTGIGLAAYYIGKKIFHNEGIGIVAMVFTMFEFQLLQHAQWAIYPIALCFFTLPAFYYTFKLLQSNRRQDFIWAGLTCGLAISVQNQGMFLIPSLLLGLFLNYRKNKESATAENALKNAGLALIFLFLFSLLGNFYWFFIFKKAFAKTAELAGVTRVGFSSAPAYKYNFFSMSWWFLQELVRQDGILGIFMGLGIFYALIKRRGEDLIFLLFLGVYLWANAHWGFRLMHDVISLLPVTCIFAAKFIVETSEKYIKKTAYYGIISCLVVLPLANDALRADIRKLHKDTRQLARDWIETNIAPGAKIAMDWPIYEAPLKSDIPFLFWNPVAKKYYHSMLPEGIKEQYRQYLQKQKTYQIIELMYPTDEPLWPKDLSAKALETAKGQYVYRDLYSRFNFRSLEELKSAGARYIVITSYAWGFFLLYGDPNKNNLFNPFFKDRPQFTYYHLDHYIDDRRHGLVYFLARQGRNFYQPLLVDQAQDYRLIKEFRPGQDNLGPVIKIFEVRG